MAYLEHKRIKRSVLEVYIKGASRQLMTERASQYRSLNLNLQSTAERLGRNANSRTCF